MNTVVYILLNDTMQDGFNPQLLWHGEIRKLYPAIRELVDKITNDEWFDEDDVWVEGDGRPLFGVSTTQSKNAFCEEVCAKYKDDPLGLVDAIDGEEVDLERVHAVYELSQLVHICIGL